MNLGVQKYPFVSSLLEGKGKIEISNVIPTLISFDIRPTSIILTSDINNVDALYFGGASITSAGVNAAGYLNAGDSITLNFDTKNNRLYVISASGIQYLWAGAFQ